ncbi:hypothetical protein LSH36_322g05030 [Paralvinella palmiformis]|uniref:Glutamate receptor n=1 Tax=Paralvinella palmiformis TaxID=53620 RepID=A0AAD9JGS0_9ANNE|nr:hypothetical protein LSH36_322g05030 [Paralvinella palmiformis]
MGQKDRDQLKGEAPFRALNPGYWGRRRISGLPPTPEMPFRLWRCRGRIAPVMDLNPAFPCDLYDFIAYKEVSCDGVMKAYVPCRAVRYTASFVQKKTPFLLVADGGQDDDMTSKSTPCHTLEADYIAQAVKAMFLNLTNKCMMLLYTEENADYVDRLDSVFLKNDDTSEARCYFEGRVTNKSLDELAESLSHDTGGFVLLAGENNAEIIDRSRAKGLVDSRNFWIVVSKERIEVWKSRLPPGERIILLQIPDSETNRCYKFEWPVFHYRNIVGGELVWDGLCIEILKTLASSLKFTFDLVVPPDKKWGAPMSNGTWNGMVGQVLRGDADFAIAKFTITRLRESVIDFTVPFWHEPCVMVMRKPDEKSSLIYLGPFRDEVWYSIFLAIPVMAAAMTGVALLRTRIYSSQPILNSRGVLCGLHRSLWFAYGALVQQGCSWTPHSQALRFLVGFWWFFTLVITATYTGNLIAVLAVPKLTLPVNTLQDLANQNFYKYGVVADTAIYSMIKLSASKLYKKMWRNSVQNKENLVMSHIEGLQRVTNDNYIYLGELGGVAPVVYNNCIYAVGREEFFPSSFAFVFPEKSPYLPFINKKMIALIENGIIEKWKTEYYPRDMCSLQANGHSSDPASIRDTQGAFFLLCFGVVIALLLLLVEGLWSLYKKCRKKSRRTSARRTNIIHELVVIRLNQPTR